MLGIIIITHGCLAQTLLNTVENIIGKQTDVVAINFEVDESFESLKQKVSNTVRSFVDGCIIFTDIFGGSPCNVCIEFLSDPKVRVITGVNIPMLLEAFNNRNCTDIKLLANKVITVGCKSIIDVGEYLLNRAKK